MESTEANKNIYWDLNDGTKMPTTGLGTFAANDKNIYIDSVKAGARLIDTASFYENEEEIGEALSDLFNDTESGITRDDLYIVTKIWPT